MSIILEALKLLSTRLKIQHGRERRRRKRPSPPLPHPHQDKERQKQSDRGYRPSSSVLYIWVSACFQQKTGDVGHAGQRGGRGDVGVETGHHVKRRLLVQEGGHVGVRLVANQKLG